MPVDPLAPYDALLVVSFGGPEATSEVMPFLRRVTAGRGVPEERLAEVAEHYYHFGGISPINAQNRALVAAIAEELGRRGATTPVHLANRNSPPYVRDVLAELAPARLLAILTSPYRSYSSCRQYREDLGVAAEGLDVEIDKLPPYAAHPPHVAAVTAAVLDAVRAALAPHNLAGRRDLALVCVAHSIPDAADAASGTPAEGGHAYARGLATMAAAVTEAVNAEFGLDLAPDLAWCSRSGPPQVAWLEPDICDRLDVLATAGVHRVVVAPIGFVSDHLEVAYDLDTEARDHARALGLEFHRAATVGTDPVFVGGLVDLVFARATAARHGHSGDPGADIAPGTPGACGTPPAADLALLAALPPADCPPDCCRSQRPPKRTLCGREEPR